MIISILASISFGAWVSSRMFIWLFGGLSELVEELGWKVSDNIWWKLIHVNHRIAPVTARLLMVVLAPGAIAAVMLYETLSAIL